MAEEIKVYRRRSSRHDKKNPKHKRFSKILIRQTICSLAILSILFGLKGFEPFKESKANAFVRNILTQPVQIHPVLKNIINAPKNAFTKEGSKIETPENRIQKTD